MKRYPNVTSFKDRHGKRRYRWRKTGFRQYLFKHQPYTPEFDAEFHGCTTQTLKPGENRATLGTIDDLVNRYLKSAAFLRPGDGTQHANRLILERFRAEFRYDLVGNFTPEHIETILVAATKKRRDGKRMVGGPEGARKLRKELRKLFKYAVRSKMIAGNPVDQADDLPLHRSSGHHTWTEEEIAQFQERHPLGTKARLALEIALWTGQRRGDVYRFGPAHLKGGKIHYEQEKGGKALWLPAAPQLLAAIKAMPAVGMTTFIVTEHGKPFSKAGFGNKFRDWCDEAGLPHCTIHGLRKSLATRLANAGSSNQQLKAVGGWSKDAQVATYTAAADQARLAEQGFALIEEKPKWKNPSDCLSGRDLPLSES